MNMKKFIALLLAAVLCLSFAACGGNDDVSEETTTAPVVEDDSTAAVDAQVEESSAAVEESSAAEVESTEEATEAASEETSEEESEAATEEATEAAKAPQGTAEIVAYFNTAVNKVKTDAKSVKQNHVTNYLAASPTVPSVLASIYKMLGGDEWLDGMLVDNSQGSATYTTKADIQAKFPVENKTWASKLTADDVKSATCTEKDGVYTITIVTKPDGKSSTIDYGEGHTPKALNAVPPRIINDNIPGIATSITGTAAMNYPLGKVVITVDAATGNVKTAEYDVQWTINFDKAGAIIPLGTRSSYVVTF